MLRPLDLDLPELDHLELALLTLRLIDERSQVCLADFAIRVLLVDLVLILRMLEFTLQLDYFLFLVFICYNQVLIDAIDCVWCHCFLLLSVCCRQLVNHGIETVLVLARIPQFFLQLLD